MVGTYREGSGSIMRPWILIGGALSIAKNQVAVVSMHRAMIGRKKRMHESTYVYNTGGLATGAQCQQWELLMEWSILFPLYHEYSHEPPSFNAHNFIHLDFIHQKINNTGCLFKFKAHVYPGWSSCKNFILGKSDSFLADFFPELIKRRRKYCVTV